jgi:formylglycine-generating enzyme required for sulfatase activity
MAEQRALIEKLTGIVRGCPEFRRAEAAGELISLPTGDGMVLAFFGDPEAAIRCAIEVAHAIADQPDIRIRTGIHSGPVYRVRDVNANLNVSGGGINIAQRVMDAGDAGHILVSGAATELLGQIGSWKLEALGEHEVKHGLRVRLFNLCSEGVGNPELPAALKRARGIVEEVPPPAPKPEAKPAPGPAAPKAVLVLPPGFRWAGGEPPGDCPFADPDGYAAWVQRQGAITIRHEESGMELVWVPPGSLMMGSVRGREDEKPIRRVSVDAFWVGRTAVSIAQWQRVMESVPPQFNDQGAQHPVTGVTWDETRELCKRLGLALPPERYWEYAARGHEGRIYPWGNSWEAPLCQCRDDLHGHARTAPAGSLPGNASWCGALDMAGNVWEWCLDWYHPTPQEGTPQPSGRRSLRGGAYASDSFECRSSCRLSSAPQNRSPLIGCRVARPKAG